MGQGKNSKYLLEENDLLREIDYESIDIGSLEGITLGSSKSIPWLCQLGHRYMASPYARSRKKVGCSICAGKQVLPGFNDLESQFPVIALSWNKNKNGATDPKQVHKGSNKKYWWVCEVGHEWEAAVSKRAAGNNCPVCSNKTVRAGTNDLGSLRPELVQFWSATNLQSPSNFTAGSHISVWWECQHSHKFKSQIRKQAKGFTCPKCEKKRVIPGDTDFFSRYPKFKIEWDSEKNESAAPNNLSVSSVKYWWKCDLGHSFQSTTSHRARGQGCPICKGKKVLIGFNDLATTHPALFLEISTKGKVASGNLVSKGSDKKLEWLCPNCSQTYLASVSSRVRGSACPVCANLKVVEGVNDIATTHPELAALWDAEKNELLRPVNLVKGSNKKYFWRCRVGHSFKSSANELRVDYCPVCNNRVVEPGVNDLATLFPEFLPQWSKQNKVLPSQVFPGSPKRAIWICNLGHTYSQAINAHIFRGQSCPYCSNTKILTGFNDLVTTNPELLDEWDWEKNKYAPSLVIAGTNKKLWWKCQSGHSWAATGGHRLSGRGCPSCSAGGFDSTAPGTLYWLHNSGLSAMKIGITGRDKSRLANLLQSGWTLLFRWDSPQGARVRFVETHFLRWVRGERKLPAHLSKADMGRLGGASETFSDEIGTEIVRAKLFEIIHLAESLTEIELQDVAVTRPRRS